MTSWASISRSRNSYPVSISSSSGERGLATSRNWRPQQSLGDILEGAESSTDSIGDGNQSTPQQVSQQSKPSSIGTHGGVNFLSSGSQLEHQLQPSRGSKKSGLESARGFSASEVPELHHHQCPGCQLVLTDDSVPNPYDHPAVIDFGLPNGKRNKFDTDIKIKMADELPLFPKATTMYLHSGNMINWNRLKRRPNLSSSEELCEVITDTLNAYLEGADKTELQYVTEVYKVKTENVEVIEESERGDVKMTVKIFICDSNSPSVVVDAVNKVLNELGTSFIETLLLAISPNGGEDQDSEEPVSFSTVQSYWKVMEELVAKDKVLSLGICDFGKEGLETLYNWAQVKPCVNQVNLESCCVLPKDLTEYAKSINVQLLTHNDRPVFITKELLQEKILSVTTERDSDAWAPEWVIRYSGILKCRGIIKTKGYIFHATRDNKKRIL